MPVVLAPPVMPVVAPATTFRRRSGGPEIPGARGSPAKLLNGSNQDRYYTTRLSFVDGRDASASTLIIRTQKNCHISRYENTTH